MTVSCRGTYSAGASVPITLSLAARQGTCMGAASTATATASVACCVTSSGAADVSSVAAPSGASICLQHGGLNAPCTSSTRPPSGPFSWGYVNRGALLGGVLRAGLQSGCASTVNVGVASVTCASSRAIAFNVTLDAASDIQFAFWVGCTAPSNVTTASTRTSGSSHGSSCFTWRQVPKPGGPVSALQPTVTVNGAGRASYTWASSLTPTITCGCSNLYWAVYATGTHVLPAADCAQQARVAARASRGNRRALP